MFAFEQSAHEDDRIDVVRARCDDPPADALRNLWRSAVVRFLLVRLASPMRVMRALFDRGSVARLTAMTSTS
ncbi:hypothetical protein E1267_37665 [Nonomuraea longispora]|uniref:Uncharacterized protein n=1 Tax=Nonomuraea longispora TaxID=1848320 RepID=A0A4R4MTD5_9ACTN|nr:hypothetical protein [Nonomuraea longispora]TDB99420.1 hypothetical protein E1267_37665 [Nonomuraea longispora]